MEKSYNRNLKSCPAHPKESVLSAIDSQALSYMIHDSVVGPPEGVGQGTELQCSDWSTESWWCVCVCADVLSQCIRVRSLTLSLPWHCDNGNV